MYDEVIYKLTCNTEGCNEIHTISMINDTTINCNCGKTTTYKADENENYLNINDDCIKDLNKLLEG